MMDTNITVGLHLTKRFFPASRLRSMNLLDQCFEVTGPDTLLFGCGTIADIGPRIDDWGTQALVVTDSGVREAGLIDGVTKTITEEGFEVTVFDDVDADPALTTATDCAAVARDVDADVIVGVGGGSTMDVTKAAALAVDADTELATFVDADTPLVAGVPTVLVPTTAGTGSEVSPAAVLRDENGEKVGLIDPALYADLAVVDPDLSMQLPPSLTAATGIDAFAHAVGSVSSIDANEFADALCIRAMSFVETHLRDAVYHGSDAPDARVGMAAAATLAMLGRVNGGKAAIHSIAYGIQARYDVPHGDAIGLVLPAVLAYNAPAAVDTYAALGTQLYDATGDPRSRTAKFVGGVRQLRDDVGLDRSLQAVGGTADDLDELADLAVHSTRHLRANPRTLTRDDARTLLSNLL